MHIHTRVRAHTQQLHDINLAYMRCIVKCTPINVMQLFYLSQTIIQLPSDHPIVVAGQLQTHAYTHTQSNPPQLMSGDHNNCYHQLHWSSSYHIPTTICPNSYKHWVARRWTHTCMHKKMGMYTYTHSHNMLCIHNQEWKFYFSFLSHYLQTELLFIIMSYQLRCTYNSQRPSPRSLCVLRDLKT